MSLAAHINEPVAPLRSRRPDVPQDLEAVVLRCLAKDPEERFPSVASLEQALRGCRSAGEWIEAEAAAWWNTFSTGIRSDGSQTVERA